MQLFALGSISSNVSDLWNCLCPFHFQFTRSGREQRSLCQRDFTRKVHCLMKLIPISGFFLSLNLLNRVHSLQNLFLPLRFCFFPLLFWMIDHCFFPLSWHGCLLTMIRGNCRFIPFSGGPRKCVGDQFAMLEAIVALAIFLERMNFELIPDQNISMTTGATIHTTNVCSLC